MRQLTMHNGHVCTPSVRVECTNCDDRQQYERRDDDPQSVVRCVECGKRHSRDSLVDTNTPGADW